MTLDEHARHLGGLIANLHSLEFILRAFLQKSPSARPTNLSQGTDIYVLPVGTELAESEFTSYDSLGTLIDKFNALARQKGLQEINKSIVDIRDAFAHGRVSAPVVSDQLRLIKFSKPKNGKVKIIFNEVLTEKWFTDNKKLVLDAIKLVHACPCT